MAILSHPSTIGNKITNGKTPLVPVLTVIVISNTSTTTLTAPSDWNTSNNWAVCIGAGGGGGMANSLGSNVAASGAQGGSWAKKLNLPINPSDVVNLGVGIGGA